MDKTQLRKAALYHCLDITVINVQKYISHTKGQAFDGASEK